MAETRTLDQFFVAAKPIIEQQLDLAEKAAELGKAARELGFEWSQIKATLKATLQDAEDGGERLKTLVDKYEVGMGYADIAQKVNKKNFSDATVTTFREGSGEPDDLTIPPELRRAS